MANSELFYEIYDALYAGKDYDAEVDFALRLGFGGEGGGLPPAARILDIGAGTGNHAFACARRGCRVTGVDVDARMIARARAKLRAAPAEIAARVSFHHGAVATLPDNGFDMAIAMFNVVSYLPSLADLAAFMRAVAARLKPGAAFVFDAWNGVAALLDPPRNEERFVATAGADIRVGLRCETDPMNLRARLHYDLRVLPKDGAAASEGTFAFSQALWPPSILRESAEQAGFRAVAIHPLGDASRAANERDWKVLFHARRPEP